MSKNKHSKPSRMERLGKDPSFDWYFCLTCFMVAIIVVALGDFAMYSNIMTPSPASAAASAPQSHIDRAEIETLAKKIRATDMDAASLSAAALRDPSAR